MWLKLLKIVIETVFSQGLRGVHWINLCKAVITAFSENEIVSAKIVGNFDVIHFNILIFIVNQIKNKELWI